MKLALSLAASLLLTLAACEAETVTGGPNGTAQEGSSAEKVPAAATAATATPATTECSDKKADCKGGGSCGSDCPFEEKSAQAEAEAKSKGQALGDAKATLAAAASSVPTDIAPEAGCPHHAEAGETVAAGAEGHYGSAFTLEQAKALSALGEDVDKLADQKVQVSGTIDAVCQKKGCWMVIADGEVSARILMKNHGFAVPIDSKGKGAVVEGTLKVRTFNEAQVKHLEADRGGDPSKVSGSRRELVLTATGVKIKG